MRILGYLLVCLGIFSFFSHPAYAEDAYSDMSASVVVLPTFKVSLDNASINFGYVESGKSVELNPSSSYNQVKCISNKGERWCLKLSIAGEISAPPGSMVTPDSFKWKIDSSTGEGAFDKEWHPFSKEQVVAYASGGRDVMGEEVAIKFSYKLDVPGNSRGGIHSANVMYSMTEQP